MKILLVEDNDYKCNDIVASLKACGETDVTRRISRNGSLIELMEAQDEDRMYDLVILDMQIPLREEEPWRILQDGGMEVFEEIKRCEYDTLVAFCSSELIENEDALMCIRYDSSVWMKPLFEELLVNAKYALANKN